MRELPVARRGKKKRLQIPRSKEHRALVRVPAHRHVHCFTGLRYRYFH